MISLSSYITKQNKKACGDPGIKGSRIKKKKSVTMHYQITLNEDVPNIKLIPLVISFTEKDDTIQRDVIPVKV